MPHRQRLRKQHGVKGLAIADLLKDDSVVNFNQLFGLISETPTQPCKHLLGLIRIVTQCSRNRLNARRRRYQQTIGR